MYNVLKVCDIGRLHAGPFARAAVAGQLVRLDMTGYGLTCAFPGLALANLRALRQLYLGGNMLSVGSDCYSAVLQSQ